MIETEFHSHEFPPPTSAPPSEVLCPFHDGPETLDGLLAELTRDSSEDNLATVDAALDLRCALPRADQPADAERFLHTLLRLRGLLGGRHYLAFYRVRCWARRVVRAEVRRHRGERWTEMSLSLDAGNLHEAVNSCLAPLADERGTWPAFAQLRFRFASEPSQPLSSAASPQ